MPREVTVVLGASEGPEVLESRVAGILGLDPKQVYRVELVKRSIDARGKGPPRVVLRVKVYQKGEEATHGADHEWLQITPFASPSLGRQRTPIIVGSGPAGLFAALVFVGAGLKPIVIERGAPVNRRAEQVRELLCGRINSESNICFGEGGAGTFSDGKLTTRKNHPLGAEILRTFVRFGASRDILVDAHPHVGTDRLRRLVRHIREYLVAAGTCFRFNARVNGLIYNKDRVCGVKLEADGDIAGDAVLLGIGHSARDTYAMLRQAGLAMEVKGFAVGLRVEHPQSLVDEIQFGQSCPQLGPATYRLAVQVGSRGVYTFCMCPGGVIVPTSVREEELCVNGMSSSRRDGAWANAAVVVSVGPADFRSLMDAHGPLAGLAFQCEWEAAAARLGGGRLVAPAQDLLDFVGGGRGSLSGVTTYRPGVVPADLSQCLPAEIAETLRQGLLRMGRKMHGFLSEEARLVGVETRTSSPVRLLRNSAMEAVGRGGLYPMGEGAGHAGGIVSSALDGVRVASALLERWR